MTVSLDKKLFDLTNRTARKLEMSRSRLVAKALEEYFRKEQDLALTRGFNNAHPGSMDEYEQRIAEAAFDLMREQARKEPW